MLCEIERLFIIWNLVNSVTIEGSLGLSYWIKIYFSVLIFIFILNVEVLGGTTTNLVHHCMLLVEKVEVLWYNWRKWRLYLIFAVDERILSKFYFDFLILRFFFCWDRRFFFDMLLRLIMIDLLILWLLLGNFSLKNFHTLNKPFIFILAIVLIEYRSWQVDVIVVLYFHNWIFFLSLFEIFKFFYYLRLIRQRRFLVGHARYWRSVAINQLEAGIILFLLGEGFWIIVIYVLLNKWGYLFLTLIVALSTRINLLRCRICLVKYFTVKVLPLEFFGDLCLFLEG